MEFKCVGSTGWTATIFYNPPDKEVENSLPSIILWVRGNTEDQTKGALDYLVKMFADGRECFFRARPEVNYDRNFDTKEEWWQGFARFSFVSGNDRWSDVDQPTRLPLGSLGAV